MKNITTIQLEKQTREDLKMFGAKDDTYNEIIRRLIEIAKRQSFYSRQKYILENERFVSLENV